MFDKKNLFPLILAAGFISTTAFAQAAPAPTAEQKAARAEIETLTKRIEELAKKLDGNTKVQVMVVEKSADGEPVQTLPRPLANAVILAEESDELLEVAAIGGFGVGRSCCLPSFVACHGERA